MIDNEQPQIDYLADDYKKPLVYATSGQRFANFIIDSITFYLFIIAMTFGFMALNNGHISESDLEVVTNPIVSSLLYALFYGLTEAITGGKTMGKLITGTRAVYEDGERISFSTGLLRGLSRAVPFEPFSAFGAHPWHDKWTKTRVVVQ